ncbi:MAG: DUF58 domain-containing protein [Actinomyces sp.]|nr:MAG: DUF58 domain-containing protein [Actinomyces sp.]
MIAPTRAGWALLVGGLLAVAAGWILGPVEFHVLGTVATAAVAVALAVRAVRPSRVRIGRRVAPPRLAAGEPARIDLAVVNTARRRSPLLRLRDRVGDGRTVSLSIAPLAPGETVVGAYRLPTTRRGVVELGPVRVTDVDPLGLARRHSEVDSVSRLVVHPPIEPLPRVRAPLGDDPFLGEEINRRHGARADDFDGLRTYVPGDDLRRVHWPSSARHDELLVRQYRPPRHGRLQVVIDTRPPGDDELVADRTTSVAGSIAVALLEAGDAVRVLTTDGRSTPWLMGGADVQVALEFLARLEGGGPGIASDVPEPGSTVVAVSADPTLADDPTARRALVERLVTRVLITLDTRAWRPDAAGSGASPGWIHLTGPGQLGRLFSLGGPSGAMPTGSAGALR